MTINFHKYQGTGNDFILIDSFNDNIQLNQEQISKMCDRRFGIGADGLMILRRKKGFDFDMDFYNSDGNPGSMCGNGGRCIVAFAHDQGIISDKANFWAPDGEHEATFKNHDEIALKMINVDQIENSELGLVMDTGSPHLVLFKEDDKIDVYNEGKKIRFSDAFKENGINVNFVIPAQEKSTIFTYERGVENQTYSCGTGTVASALALNKEKNYNSPIHFNTLGGDLSVSFEQISNNTYRNIWLTGPAKQTYSGIYNLFK